MSEKTVGQKIKSERVRLGLTQENLAKMIFTNKCTISHYEHDRIDIRLSTLRLLCDALKITPNYLMGYSDGESEITEAYSRIKSSEAREMILTQVKVVSENF